MWKHESMTSTTTNDQETQLLPDTWVLQICTSVLLYLTIHVNLLDIVDAHYALWCI